MSQELKVIADFYDFMLWTIGHTEKFPRHHRYSLGLTIENRLQHLLELLIRAKYAREKAGLLNDVNIELEILRYMPEKRQVCSMMSILNWKFFDFSCGCPVGKIRCVRQHQNRE